MLHNDVGDAPFVAQSHYALLLRGQTHRWGCDAVGRELQRAALRSQIEMLVSPLGGVDIFLSLSRSCNSTCDDDVREAVGRTNVVSERNATAREQSANVQSAVGWFMRTAEARYRTLVMMRYDVLLLSPVTAWACNPSDPDRISLASPVEERMWLRYNWTSDLMQIVPQRWFRVFADALGAR